MPRYKANWNILTAGGVVAPGTEFEMEADEAARLPEGACSRVARKAEPESATKSTTFPPAKAKPVGDAGGNGSSAG